MTFVSEAMQIIEPANWYVLSTQPKREKFVASKLGVLGLKVFLPTYVVTRSWSDRKKKVVVPLIPHYIFVHLCQSKLSVVYNVAGVNKVLTDSLTKRPIPVTDKEIEALREASSVSGKTRSEIVVRGNQAHIVKGPLSGLIGTVVESNGKGLKLLVALKSIMSSFTVEVDFSMCTITHLR